ncbi:hypothetical protein [Nocardia sp. CC227C]|uniref:hypothetical protein n=1 Tax=Nocardia sp. CC227C TaxID=3044562 RepID=UPI00278C1655|nr:hypothetical protein [Nocardia sp. CC227C]
MNRIRPAATDSGTPRALTAPGSAWPRSAAACESAASGLRRGIGVGSRARRARAAVHRAVMAGRRSSGIITAAVVPGVPYAVRLVTGAAAPIAASGYVEAAAAGGEHLVFREVLPNLRAILPALFGLRFVAAVYIVATAGFLEIGPQTPGRRLGTHDPGERPRRPPQPLGGDRP